MQLCIAQSDVNTLFDPYNLTMTIYMIKRKIKLIGINQILHNLA